MLALESGYYPPGAEFDKRAPWNQREQPEEEWRVHEQLPAGGYRTRPRWVEVAPEDYDQPHGVTPEALLAACQAQEPTLVFEIRTVDRD